MTRGWLITVLCFAAGCVDHDPRSCGSDDECKLEGFAGECVAAYCAYPDAACAGELRYGPFAAPGLAGECLEVSPTSSTATSSDDETSSSVTTGAPSTSSPLTSSSTIAPTTEDPSDSSESSTGCALPSCSQPPTLGEELAWGEPNVDDDVRAVRGATTLCIAGVATEDAVSRASVRAVDATGAVLFDVVTAAGQPSTALDCEVFADQRVVSVGTLGSLATRSEAGFVRAHDFAGDELWTRVWDTAADDAVRSVAAAADVAVAGGSRAGLPWVEGVDATGNTVWIRSPYSSVGDLQVHAAASVGGVATLLGVAGSDPASPWYASFDAEGTTWGSRDDPAPSLLSIDAAARGSSGSTSFASFGRNGSTVVTESSTSNWETITTGVRILGLAVRGDGTVVAAGVLGADAWLGGFSIDGTQSWQLPIAADGVELAAVSVVAVDERLFVLGTARPKGGLRDAWLRDYSF